MAFYNDTTATPQDAISKHANKHPISNSFRLSYNDLNKISTKTLHTVGTYPARILPRLSS